MKIQIANITLTEWYNSEHLDFYSDKNNYIERSVEGQIRDYDGIDICYIEDRKIYNVQFYGCCEFLEDFFEKIYSNNNIDVENIKEAIKIVDNFLVKIGKLKSFV